MGQRINETLGMKKIIQHKEKGIIYSVKMDDFNDKPTIGLSLFMAVQEAKAKRVINYLKSLGEDRGMKVIKSTLSDWGYKTEEN
jgi:hypothetical protein